MKGNELTATLNAHGFAHQHGTFWNKIKGANVIALTIYGNETAHVVVRRDGVEVVNERCPYEQAVKYIFQYE